jgi:hypothetical protein
MAGLDPDQEARFVIKQYDQCLRPAEPTGGSLLYSAIAPAPVWKIDQKSGTLTETQPAGGLTGFSFPHALLSLIHNGIPIPAEFVLAGQFLDK